MRFEFYHSGLDSVPKLSVDGTVDNSIHFSHWEGNRTPAEVKADTSTEIALNLVASPNRSKLTEGIELVTNNHFDTDGLMSVWTVLNGERALDHRESLIAAAEAGDFSEFNSEQGVRASIVIQGSDQAGSNNESGSPLARQLAGEDVDEERSYELLLPQVEHILTHTDDYESLWRTAWEQIAKAIDSFEAGHSRVEEFSESKISLVTLAPDIFINSGFSPTRHSPPFTAISRYAHGHLFLIGTPVADGWVYRLDYPYYSWADTVIRPKINRRNLGPILKQLNELENGREGSWQEDRREMTSAAKFLNPDSTPAVSSLMPDDVCRILSGQTQLSATGV
jgi:hypothetical protein